jgi:hypothetical protein
MGLVIFLLFPLFFLLLLGPPPPPPQSNRSNRTHPDINQTRYQYNNLATPLVLDCHPLVLTLVVLFCLENQWVNLWFTLVSYVTAQK